MNLTEKYRSRLAELFPFWGALNAEQQERLKNALQVKCFSKNELVTIESRRKDGLLLVLEGRLRVYISAENGREISILFLTKGDPFSIITVDSAGPFDIVPQLQATERAVLAYIPKADFMTVATCVPQASEYLLNVAAGNAQGILNCIEKHLFCSLRHGIARIILSRPNGKRATASISPTSRSQTIWAPPGRWSAGRWSSCAALASSPPPEGGSASWIGAGSVFWGSCGSHPQKQ